MMGGNEKRDLALSVEQLAAEGSPKIYSGSTQHLEGVGYGRECVKRRKTGVREKWKN
jgi:hypothetical protein